MTLPQGSYDAVIIGAGPVGVVIAKELSDRGKRVLLLEAGRASGLSYDGWLSYGDTFRTATMKEPNSPYPPNANAQSTYSQDIYNMKKHVPILSGYQVEKGPLAFGSTYLRSLGGTSLHWLGTCPRMVPADFRMKNFIKPEQFPYKSPTGWEYDSGNYGEALQLAMDMIGYRELRAEQAEKRARGELMGIGISSFTEVVGAGPSKDYDILGIKMFDSAEIRIHPTGKAIARFGTKSQGQGHETTYAQIVAEEFVEFVDIGRNHRGRAQRDLSPDVRREALGYSSQGAGDRAPRESGPRGSAEDGERLVAAFQHLVGAALVYQQVVVSLPCLRGGGVADRLYSRGGFAAPVKGGRQTAPELRPDHYYS